MYIVVSTRLCLQVLMRRPSSVWWPTAPTHRDSRSRTSSNQCMERSVSQTELSISTQSILHSLFASHLSVSTLKVLQRLITLYTLAGNVIVARGFGTNYMLPTKALIKFGSQQYNVLWGKIHHALHCVTFALLVTMQRDTRIDSCFILTFLSVGFLHLIAKKIARIF